MLRIQKGVSHAACPLSAGRDFKLRDTLGASTPEDDLGFVDLVAGVVGSDQARGVASSTVNVDHPAAGSADEVVVVITDPVLVAGRRPGRLDALEEALVGEDRQGVVHRLTGDGTDIGPYGLVDFVRRAVRSVGHCPQNGQTLGRDLQTVLAENAVVN